MKSFNEWMKEKNEWLGLFNKKQTVQQSPEPTGWNKTHPYDYQEPKKTIVNGQVKWICPFCKRELSKEELEKGICGCGETIEPIVGDPPNQKNRFGQPV